MFDFTFATSPALTRQTAPVTKRSPIFIEVILCGPKGEVITAVHPLPCAGTASLFGLTRG